MGLFNSKPEDSPSRSRPSSVRSPSGNKDSNSNDSNSAPSSISLNKKQLEELEKIFFSTHTSIPKSKIAKKLFPIEMENLLASTLEELQTKKLQDLLQTPEFKDKIELIFQNDKLKNDLEEKAKLNSADVDQAGKLCFEKVKTAEYAKLFIDRVDIMQDPKKFYNHYFSDDPEGLKILLRKEFEDRDESAINSSIAKYTNAKEIAFKLLLTSIGENQNRLWRLAQSVFAKMTETWGASHAGLQIGPYIIDWNDSSLIVPRYLSSRHAKALIPINDKIVLQKEKSLMAICEAICEWNREYSYTTVKMIGSGQGNCQDFVQFVLDKLSVSTNWAKNGPVDKYIQKIASGTLKDPVIVDPDGNEFTIENHEKLREFYFKVKKNPKVTENSALNAEYDALAKCLERSFQLKQERDPSIQIFSPIFGDFTGRVK